jgi:hypothetical protein
MELIKFWDALKSKLAEHKLDFLDRVGSKPYSHIAFGKGRGKFAFCIGKVNYRVELYISDDSDKAWIDAMAKYKEDIQAKHKGLIEWERLENKKASRIKFEMPQEIFNTLQGRFNEGQSWGQITNWYSSAMKEFYSVLYPYWEKVQREQ